jgi:type II secretory pathway component PulM
MNDPDKLNIRPPEHTSRLDFSGFKRLLYSLRSGLQHWQTLLLPRWQVLAPWQQHLCRLTGCIVLIVLVWSGLWQPLQQAHLRADQALQQHQQKQHRMQTQAAMLANWPTKRIAETPQNPTRDISQITRNTAGLYGVQISILASNHSDNRSQAGTLAVHINNTRWPECLRWIAALHRQQIGLVSIHLQSGTQGLDIEATIADRSISE